MAFFDDEEEFSAFEEEEERPGRPVAGPDRQIFMRRLVALGVAVLIFILMVLAVRGCLDARKERAFENYIRDLEAITVESGQLSDSFFGLLQKPEDLKDIPFESEVNANRGAAEGLLSRAQGLDAPDEISGAQSELATAFELLRDAFEVISSQIKTALGNRGASKAIKQIAEQMEVFLASDVLYGRARSKIQTALAEEDIVAKVPRSEFLPSGSNAPDWLDPNEIASLLGGVAGDPGDVSGIHGLGLVGASLSGTTLTDGSSATVPAEGAELTVEVQNQGEATESNVGVTYTLDGTKGGKQTISTIAAGTTESVTLAVDDAQPGTTVALVVTVDTVPGETVETNNTASYTITFE